MRRLYQAGRSAPFPLRNVDHHLEQRNRSCKGKGCSTMHANYPVDRWLVCFRAQANLLPKDNTTQPSGGWENFPNSSLDKAIEQQWGMPNTRVAEQGMVPIACCYRPQFRRHALHMPTKHMPNGEEAILNKINEFVSGLQGMPRCPTRDEIQRQSPLHPPRFPCAYGESGSSRRWRNTLHTARLGTVVQWSTRFLPV